MSPTSAPSIRAHVVSAVRAQLEQSASRGDTLLVGVSGGPDSVCLLDAAASLRRELGLTLHVAHLNHQLRGDESEADARFVVDLAGRLGLTITVGREDTRAFQKRSRRSLEDAARQLRHQFFAEVVQQTGATAVLLAHTADDQAETVLLRLIRGTGPRGLSGIRPRSTIAVPGTEAGATEIVLLRPLLPIWRSEVLEYLAETGLTYREDSTNRTPIAQRNRVRSRLLPLIEKENPRAREALVRLAGAASIESDFLERQVDRLWPVAVEEEAEAIVLRCPELQAAPRAVRRRLLLRALERTGPEANGSAVMDAVDRLEAALVRNAGGELHLPGVRAVVEYRQLRLARDSTDNRLPPIDGEVPLAVPGETVVGGWRVRAEVQAAPDSAPAVPPDRWTAYLDPERLGGLITIRTRRPGDRFVPTGMNQLKKLQDYFVDAHVPQRLRDRVPLVVGPDGIAWVVGQRQDARYLPGPNADRILVIAFEPLEGG